MHDANEIAVLFKRRGKTRDVRRLGVGFEVAWPLKTFVSKKHPNKRHAIISGYTDAKQTRVLGSANGISFQGA